LEGLKLRCDIGHGESSRRKADGAVAGRSGHHVTLPIAQGIKAAIVQLDQREDGTECAIFDHEVDDLLEKPIAGAHRLFATEAGLRL
jgi:hypothetical protein